MGNTNLAARRAAKAIRRKAVVAQKRRTEAVEGSLAGQAARAAILPMRCCLVSKDLEKIGMGTLIVARGSAAVGRTFFAGFLLDTFCLGVKNTMARTVDDQQLEAMLAKVNAEQPLVKMNPICARKMLHELVDWSGLIGVRPHRDYAALERVFGDVDAEACGCEYEFGFEGKPLYMNGPFDPAMMSREIVRRLHAELGPEGSNYMIGSPANAD